MIRRCDMEASISAGAVHSGDTKKLLKTQYTGGQVSEGDQIKNDGRYLYQMPEKRPEEDTRYPWRTRYSDPGHGRGT